LILRQISEFDAIRCQILRLKCTKFDVRLGSLLRSPDPLAVFKGATSKCRAGEQGGEGRGREREWEVTGGGKEESK